LGKNLLNPSIGGPSQSPRETFPKHRKIARVDRFGEQRIHEHNRARGGALTVRMADEHACASAAADANCATFRANGARVRASGAGEVVIQLAPANADANAFAACANGARTMESGFRGPLSPGSRTAAARA